MGHYIGDPLPSSKPEPDNCFLGAIQNITVTEVPKEFKLGKQAPYFRYPGELTLNEYQEKARTTAIYCDQIKLLYPVLGLAGEAGEVVEKLSQILFPKGKYPTEWDDKSFSLRMLWHTLDNSVKAALECERVKKLLRDHPETFPAGVLDEIQARLSDIGEAREGLLKEVSDVCWYTATTAGDLDAKLGDVGQANLDKLAARKAKGTLSGSGDTR